MRKRWKAAAGIWLAGAVMIASGCFTGTDSERSLLSAGPVQAAQNPTAMPQASTAPQTDSGDSGDWQDRISAAQKKRQELQQEQRQIEAEVDRVKAVADNVKKYVKTLDAQFIRLMYSIEANRTTIRKTEEEVEAVNEEFEKAQERQQVQYDSMKARIKYMYENSEDSYLQFLLESRSLAEIFSREEYIEKITGYDKSLFSRYQTVLDEVTAARERAQAKLDEVEAAKEALKYEKETMKKLVKEKNRQIQLYQGLLEGGQQNLNDYAQQIASQEQEIEALLQKQRDQVSAQEAETGSTQQKVVPTTGAYAWPLTVRGRISSPFGYRSSPTAGASSYHKGVDIAVNMGSSVLATKDGKVVTAKYSSSAGNYVAIYHGGGIYSYYMHCSRLLVSVGAKVEKGQVIAKSGSTGISTGPHLHFAIYKNGTYVNPMYYVSQP